MAIDTVAGGRADAVAFGRAFIANRDLPRRLRANTALNSPDPAPFMEAMRTATPITLHWNK